ncbi:MAG: hypothetical protein ABR926_21405 [Streptosporangiaceae bacterium]|jgi:hypothetical protein
MRTIFDGLVEEFRAWHLFEQQAGNSAQRDLPDLLGMRLPGYDAGANGAGVYNGPSYGTPGFGTPAFGTAGYGQADFGAPDFGTPDFGTPGYGAGYDRASRHSRDLGGTPPQPGAPL